MPNLPPPPLSLRAPDSFTEVASLPEIPRMPSVDMFAECFIYFEHSVKSSLPSVIKKTLGKINILGKDEFLPSVFSSHLTKSSLPSVLFFALSKNESLPSVFLTLRKGLRFFPVPASKLFRLSTYNMCYSMLKFNIFLYLFSIFN